MGFVTTPLDHLTYVSLYKSCEPCRAQGWKFSESLSVWLIDATYKCNVWKHMEAINLNIGWVSLIVKPLKLCVINQISSTLLQMGTSLYLCGSPVIPKSLKLGYNVKTLYVVNQLLQAHHRSQSVISWVLWICQPTELNSIVMKNFHPTPSTESLYGHATRHCYRSSY